MGIARILSPSAGANLSAITATENDVLSTKVIVGKDGKPLTGKIPVINGGNNLLATAISKDASNLILTPPSGNYFNGGGVYADIASVLAQTGAKRHASGSYTIDGSSAPSYEYNVSDGGSVSLVYASAGFLSGIPFAVGHWAVNAKFSTGEYTFYQQHTESSGFTYYYSYSGGGSSGFYYQRPYMLKTNGPMTDLILPGKYNPITVTWSVWEQ